MHELSIARSIIDLVEEQVARHASPGVEELELEIGYLSGVEVQTLRFALDSAVKGTRLDNARIVWRYIDGEGQCSDCENTFKMDTLLTPCPFCGSYLVKITKGKELRIKSIVVK